MSSLERKSWPNGWTPDADALTGNPDGLLTMKNLDLDEEAALTLTRGTETISELSNLNGFVHTLYSKQVNNKKYRFAATSSGAIYASYGEGPYVFVSEGSPSIAAFDYFLGWVLMASGSQRWKFSPQLNTLLPLGIKPPDGWSPFVESFTAYQHYLINGSQVSYVASTAGFPVSYHVCVKQDLYSLANGEGNFGKADDPGQDIISFKFKVNDVSKITAVTLYFYGFADANTNQSHQDNFSKTWYIDDQNVVVHSDEWVTLKAFRSEFEVSGPNSIDWNNIFFFSISVSFDPTFIGGVSGFVTDLFIQGGQYAQLTGMYEYALQYIYKDSNYVAKSPLTKHTQIRVFKGYTKIDLSVMQADGVYNDIWIFRRKIPDPSLDTETTQAFIDGEFYFVGSIFDSTKYDNNSPARFMDSMSDSSAVILNIKANQFLRAVNDTGSVGEILGMVPTGNGRMLYISYDYLYVSDSFNPDAVDYRYVLRPGDQYGDKNIFITRLPNGNILLGTTKDFYEFGGTFEPLPDNTIDAQKRGLGEAHPPICHQFSNNNGDIIYTAKDGIRITSRGAASELLTSSLNGLFTGLQRQSVAPIALLPQDNAYYPNVVVANKLFTVLPLKDGKRTGFILDILKRYWFQYDIDPFCLFVEEDGTILAGYDDAASVQIIWSPLTSLIGGVTKQAIELMTVFDDNGQPRNRKDTFSFKIIADSGGDDVNILLAKDGSSTFYDLGTVQFNGKTERIITIANVIGLGKRIAIWIKANAVSTFKLYFVGIEYEPRPEQLTFIRIMYNNLGTTSRKRFVNYAFVIDTMGSTCEFFPFIDGNQAGPSTTFVMDRKGTYIHYFNSEQVGTDIGGIICGFFEFYNIALEEIISEKMPTPTTYLVIPQDDYGIPNRKRHSSYKFIINTRGNSVRFTPRIDETNYPSQDYTTTEKQTVEYFFNSSNWNDPIGIDIGGVLDSLNNEPFEFYGPIRPQHIEVLPPRLKEFVIPQNNYGIPAKKRIRTMPMVLNTNGSDVIFTPIVDGVSLTPSTLNSIAKQTVFHYFTTDVFGVDYSGRLDGTQPFEFYGLEKPEEVEVIPVGKRFDQIGPFELSRLGKFLFFRLRVISGGYSIPYTIYFEDGVKYTGSIDTQPNIDTVYEEIIPKSKWGTVFRMELGPTVEVFHRYYIEAKFNISGKIGVPIEPIWIKLTHATEQAAIQQ